VFIYTVQAYRWGDRDNHSYIVGVYESKHKAISVARAEAEWRGGKYTCQVRKWKFGLDHTNGSPGMPSEEVPVDE
jgi:hypothetical protein